MLNGERCALISTASLDRCVKVEDGWYSANGLLMPARQSPVELPPSVCSTVVPSVGDPAEGVLAVPSLSGVCMSSLGSLSSGDSGFLLPHQNHVRLPLTKARASESELVPRHCTVAALSFKVARMG